MARPGNEPAQSGDATGGEHQPPPSGGALHAPRPPEPTTSAPTGRDGVIGARPPAAPAHQPASTGDLNVLRSGAAAPPITLAPAQPDVESRADATVPRAYAAQAARAAAQRSLASVATATRATATSAAVTWSRPHYWGATARTASLPEPPAGHPSKPRAPSTPAKAWALHAGQVVTWQVVLVGVLVAVQQPAGVMIPSLLGAGALLAISVPRSGGRWAYQWLGIRLRYWCRRKLLSTHPGAPIGELLRPMLRGLRLETIEIDDVEKVLLTHAGGLTIVLQLTPADGGILVESALTVPPPTVLLPSSEETGPMVSAQLVVQTTPAPNAYRAHGVVAQSYQSLAQGKIPARRRSWIALQTMRTAADADDAELRAALTRAVVHLQRRLQRVGMRGYVLDQAQLTADLAVLTGAETMWRDGGPPSIRLQERWTSWRAGLHQQVTYRLLEWPDLANETGQDFFDELVTLPSVATTLGIAARRAVKPEGKSADSHEVELEAALRVAVPPDQPDLLATQLSDLVNRRGVRMQRMNGEHVFGVAASLPLGGFVT